MTATTPVAERPPARAGWEFWIDRGGTFTDVIGVDPEERMHVAKLPSSGTGAADAAIAGIRQLLGLAPDAPIPAERIKRVRMGTTVATNALLERTGAKVLLLVTKGFADLLTIRHQARAHLFELVPTRAAPLATSTIEVDERVLADGTVERPPDLDALRPRLARCQADGIEAVAIAFLHGHRHPAHEQAVADLCREMGLAWVFPSHAVERVSGVVSRAETTVADAYLTPLLRHHVDGVTAALGDVPLEFMQSNGGLVRAAAFSGRNAVLSGPAGGIIGAATVGATSGHDRLVSFDMGGTSTDVAHWDRELERTTETEIAGTTLRTPMLRVHTVAAGGGSVCRVEFGRLRVGPQSAGAEPGPACYGRGGPAAVTDCNLVLGRLLPAAMPKVFGPDRDAPLDVEAARTQLARLAGEVGSPPPDIERLAADFIAVADEHMVKAIKAISVQRGHDLERHYALVAFGGAGGQHACQLAERLGIAAVVVHPLAGLLSAAGLGTAAMRSVRQRSVDLPLEQGMAAARAALNELEREVRAEVGPAVSVNRRAQLRYANAATNLAVHFGSATEMRKRLNDAHRQAFGYGRAPIEDVTIASVEAEAAGHGRFFGDHFVTERGELAAPRMFTRLWENGAWYDAPVYERAALRANRGIGGPALVLEDTATTYVPGGWAAALQENGTLVAFRRPTRSRRKKKVAPEGAHARPDPARLEVFHSLFMSAAEQMGHVLQGTASSVNIKERLDFSCAVFDRHGDLVANAPHIPVHLASMDVAVHVVRELNKGRMHPRDAWLINNPYAGGTHLPDLTVVSPVFVDGNKREPAFFVCSRGHHADVGGLTPGSMPADSTSLAEEGVRFDNFRIMRHGLFQDEELLVHLRSGPYPARNPSQNIEDLAAQLAANNKGITELERACAVHGTATVTAYMRHIQDNAAAVVRGLICRLRPGSFTLRGDGGSVVAVNVVPDAATGRMLIDFTGTGPPDPGNRNAPFAVVRAAVCYVLRCLLDTDIPLNAGMMQPIMLNIPPGTMINPYPGAAVAAGNVEVSQMVVDCLFGALGVVAASQGTMNNLTFGNRRHQYYETICGGAGATRGKPGTAAIHTHMTNTRITDPEILEDRYPVVLERFCVRRGSGGRGRWQGGDGVERSIRFLEEMEVTMLANRREVPPYGLQGGGDGKCGENWLQRKDGGPREDGGANATWQAQPGDVLELRTPGGGGWGER